jgi:hypothetical protein
MRLRCLTALSYASAASCLVSQVPSANHLAGWSLGKPDLSELTPRASVAGAGKTGLEQIESGATGAQKPGA